MSRYSKSQRIMTRASPSYKHVIAPALEDHSRTRAFEIKPNPTFFFLFFRRNDSKTHSFPFLSFLSAFIFFQQVSLHRRVNLPRASRAQEMFPFHTLYSLLLLLLLLLLPLAHILQIESTSIHYYTLRHEIGDERPLGHGLEEWDCESVAC